MGGGEVAFDVFFSYHGRDHAQVESVARALTDRGFRVFLDRWYLTPGQPWPQALERILASCDSVAVFVGADGLGPWQQRERDLALGRQGREPGFPVIPVLLARSDPALGFLKLNTWVDMSSSVADHGALDILCAAIRREPPGPPGQQRTAAVKAETCPYRGLRPFREEDAAFFCGREAFTERLVEAVGRSSLVAVVGASGIGKSSVVRAGLIPRLRRANDGRVWEFATLVPTDRPLHSLAAALAPILEPEMTRVERLAEINRLAGHFAQGTVALRDVAADILRSQPGSDRLLLFVDQWEELYTLVADDGARRRFLAEVLDASGHGPVTAVLTMRGDFFGQALSDRSFADRLHGAQVNLGPMTEDELGRSITEPAEKAGLQFEPGLVDRILSDVGQEPGNLPLLAFVLAALWEQRQGVTLRHDAYEGMGGVQGALAARADAEFGKLDAGQKDAARRMLIQMVRPGEETDDTRQRAVLPAGNETALTVIRRLADARLVVTARDAASGAETAEVTHEALIHHWGLLRTWIDQDREFLRSKARIEAAAALWMSEKREASRLLPAGRPLAEGAAMLASRGSDLPADAVAFIEASVAAAAGTRRRRLLTRAAVLAAALLVAAGGGIYWDFYVRDHEQYFNSFAKRWGVFEGVGRVGADDVERRSRTLRFVRQGRLGPVIRVDAVDGTGTCARGGLLAVMDPTAGIADLGTFWDSPKRLCSILWDWNSEGWPRRQTMLDAKERVMARLVYTDDQARTADFRAEKGHLLPIGTATSLTYERYEHGPNRGQDRLERGTDAFGRPQRLVTGAFAAQVEYSPAGQMIHAVFVGQDGRAARNLGGFAELRIVYDAAGNPVEVSLFDENGRPVRAKNGVARWTMSYDGHGNEIKSSYFDENGRPTRSKDGYAALTFAYGPGGKEIERAFFDEAGEATANKKGYARITWEFDTQGRLTGEAYFDETGKPTLSKEGYAKAITEYDESGNAVQEAYFDQEGKPTRTKDGYAKIVLEYDDRGRSVAAAYYDPAGRPTRSKDGYAAKSMTYDLRDNLQEEAYFDEAGRPTLSNEWYAKVTRDYDVMGHLVQEAYFDEAGKPTLSKKGHARSTTTYDDLGNKVKEAYFDAAGAATLTKEWGYASILFEHDAQGNVIKEGYHDENGNPIRSENGSASVTQTYDARGNVVEAAYFDETGKPTLIDEGYARIVRTYDGAGNEASYAFFDEAGQPTAIRLGIASTLFDYDTRGNMIRRFYFDEDGNPTRSKDGYAEITRTFDANDNVIGGAYFDESGELTEYRGYASIAIDYDARGNEIEQRYFDRSGRPTRSEDGYARITQLYGERGNLIEAAYFDESGNPTRAKDGYARMTLLYDERGNLIEEAYFDESGNPTRSKSGYARMTQTFDARGNVVAGAYFDEAGRPAADELGVFRWTAVYDARGNVIKADILDAEGKPARAKDGFASITKAYDARGNRIAEAYFDENGHPIRSADGYASKTLAYDARGNQIEEAYFDERGGPVQSGDGYAKSTKTYDSRGEVIVEKHFDEKGAEIPVPANAH